MMNPMDEQNTCFMAKLPRAEEKRILDETNGNAAKDGFTVLARRPRSMKPGDIIDLEAADRMDKFDEEYGDMMGPYSD